MRVPDIPNVVTTKQVACVAHHGMQSVGSAAIAYILGGGTLLPADMITRLDITPPDEKGARFRQQACY